MRPLVIQDCMLVLDHININTTIEGLQYNNMEAVPYHSSTSTLKYYSLEVLQQYSTIALQQDHRTIALKYFSTEVLQHCNTITALQHKKCFSTTVFECISYNHATTQPCLGVLQARNLVLFVTFFCKKRNY